MERFSSKIKRGENGCLEWQGHLLRGYGRFWDGKTSVPVHRFAYELSKGPIPDGFDVHHVCHNRRCVNPEHLEVLPKSEHVRHAMPPGYVSANARKTHCPRGHEYTTENTYVTKKGQRMCRACGREKSAEARGPKPPHYNSLKTHCPRGHEFTPENTGVGPRGGRTCKQCRREQSLAQYYKRKALKADG